MKGKGPGKKSTKKKSTLTRTTKKVKSVGKRDSGITLKPMRNYGTTKKKKR